MGGVVGKNTGMENCRFIARLYGLDPDYVEAFCRWLCGIEEYFDMPVSTYSAGMRARFNFSLLLALDFDIYLIDEGMPSTTDVEFNKRAGNDLARPAGECDRGDRVASGIHAGKVLPLGCGFARWAIVHVRHPGRGETAL